MVDTIATKSGANADTGGVTVKSGTTLEEAAKTMTDANQQFATVVDDNGKPQGVLSMNSLIQAMVTPISHLTSKAAAE